MFGRRLPGGLDRQIDQLLECHLVQRLRICRLNKVHAVDKIHPNDRTAVSKRGRNVSDAKFARKSGQKQPRHDDGFFFRGCPCGLDQMDHKFGLDGLIAFSLDRGGPQVVTGYADGGFTVGPVQPKL